MNTITIADKTLGSGYPIFFIAEAGINHQGDMSIAKELIDKAKECGADAIKFQKRTVSRILTREGLDMAYDNANSFGRTYGEHKKALELSEENYRELFAHAKECSIMFCASGWDEESIDFLDDLGLLFFKMASADLTNIPLLEHTAQKQKPMILSTGMANLSEVKTAYDVVTKYNDQIAILQCTSTYPSQFEDIHLNVLKTFQKEFPDAVIGYSGHELGIAIPPVAVAMGACIIERHFTLDRTLKGSDHAASLEPQGLSKMIRDIRHVEDAMGSNEKRRLESENPIFKKLSKSVVSVSDIEEGQVITAHQLTTKGPGTGIPPTRIKSLIGKKAARRIPGDTVIKESDVKW